MNRYKKLTLLHSNDMHGDFLAETVDETLVGGVSMLSGYVDMVRKENPNTIYCIAGDMFRGSVIDSEFRGISTIEIMNMIAPDVVTLGNHETDYGISHLLFLEKCAKFPIINANIYIRSNHVRLFRPHLVLEMDGMKVLFIGILTEGVMRAFRNDASVGAFVDIHEAAREVGRICNAYRGIDIDLTVLLTHIGHEEDKKLAEQLDPAWGVDLIIGGHSHTFLEEPAVVNGIPIAQAGTGTDQIGRFDLVIDTQQNSIAQCNWSSIPICEENCPRDQELDKILDRYKQRTDEKYNRLVTRLHRKLTHPSRIRETELGGLFSDILAECLGLDVMLLSSGSIRTKEMGPIVRYSDLVETFPYDGGIYMLKVTGSQLRRMITYMLREDVWQGAHCEFFQISRRLRAVYDRKQGKLLELTLDGKEILENACYKIGMQQYQYTSFNSFFDITREEIEREHPSRMIATSSRDILEEYLMKHLHLDHPIDGRLTLFLETQE